MAMRQLVLVGVAGVLLAAATGCTSTRGCCRKSPQPDCCPPPGPVFPAGPAAPAAPLPPTQAFSVGPTCALPLQ